MRIGTDYIKAIRKLDETSMLEFQTRQVYEVWQNVFNTHTIIRMFVECSMFVKYIQIFYCLFLSKDNIKNSNKKSWITVGIRTSNKKGRDL